MAFFFSADEFCCVSRSSRGTNQGPSNNNNDSNSLYLCLHKGCRGVDAEGEAPPRAPGGDLFLGGRGGRGREVEGGESRREREGFRRKKKTASAAEQRRRRMLLIARFPFRSPLRGPSAAPGGLRRRAPGAPSPTRARRPRERSAGRTSRAGLLSERCAVVLPARLSREKRQVSPEGEKNLDSLSTSLPCFSSPAQYPLSLPPRSLLRAPRIWSRGRVQVELEKAHLEGALPQVGFCFLWPAPTPKKKKNSRAPPPPTFCSLVLQRTKKEKIYLFRPSQKKGHVSLF